MNSILHLKQFKLYEISDKIDTEIYNARRCQSDFDFGFVPISEQLLPDTDITSKVMGKSPLAIHEIVRSTGKLCKLGSQSIHNLMLMLGKNIYRASGTIS